MGSGKLNILKYGQGVWMRETAGLCTRREACSSYVLDTVLLMAVSLPSSGLDRLRQVERAPEFRQNDEKKKKAPVHLGYQGGSAVCHTKTARWELAACCVFSLHSPNHEP